MPRVPQCSVTMVLGFLVLFSGMGCSRAPSPIRPPRLKAEEAAAAAMAASDTNKDGKLDSEELERCPALKGLAKNGVVTPDAIAAIVEQWTKGQIGRAAVTTKILHNGKPLAGAKVTAKPEPFLAMDVKTADATTGANGGTLVSVAIPDGSGPKGLPLGFYRLEVTKDGENIPAKYNTQTVLGFAVTGETILSFNLVY